MNIFPKHPSISQLTDLVENRLSFDELAGTEAHIAVCSRCFEDVTRLKRLIGVMRSDVSEDAPPSVIARAIRLFRSRMSLTPNSSGLRRRVSAMLHFDSLGLAPVFGVRSGSPETRQILYRAGANEIDLRVEPSGLAWIVSGQVLGESTEGGQVELTGEAGASQTFLNGQSEFTFPSVPTGHYRLVLNLADADIEISELKIGM